MDSTELEISPPLFLVGKKITCWRCGRRMSAVALIALNVKDTEGETCTLTDITRRPKEIFDYLKMRVPTFKLTYLRTTNTKYFANKCPKCSTLSGDFFLHSELVAPFFRTNEDEASELYLMELPIAGVVRVNPKIHMGIGDLILIVIALRNSVIVAETIGSHIVVGAAFSRELETEELCRSGMAGRILMRVKYRSAGGLGEYRHIGLAIASLLPTVLPSL